MHLSHVEIEQRKKWVIGLLLLMLIVCYFFFIWILAIVISFPTVIIIWKHPFAESLFLGFNGITVILGIALIVGIIHWHISFNRDTVPKILRVLNAQSLDINDTYHQRLRNIVEEVRVATGGQEVRCVVIPTTSMNAFSIMYFKETPIIGVTEGLLSKLKRQQLVTIIGHEMAHIISGDCLITTIISVLFGLYAEILKGSRAMIKDRLNGEDIPFFIIVYIITSIVQTMSEAMKIFISRQHEYRADAVAVRLTRDPLSLAEAIYTISRNNRMIGYGALSPIFFMNPLCSSFDENNGLLGYLFSTHPPVKKRIDILLEMVKADIEILEEAMKAPDRLISPADSTVLPSKASLKKQGWLALDEEGKWTGPFSLLELSKLSWLRPDNWVHKEGEDKVIPAFEDESLRRMFKGYLKDDQVSNFLCPHCKMELAEILYEGAPIWRCNYCEGLLVEKSKVMRILSRREQGFSEEIAKFAKFYQLEIREKERRKKTEQVEAKFSLNCPSCKKMMIRKFYSLVYPIEIDFCGCCNYIWFDKHELEVLQYLIENAN